jgi:uncharacterized protein (TIGR02996 family)
MAKDMDVLQAMLAGANKRRRDYVLTLDDVLAAAREAVQSAHGIAVRHGGGGRFITGRTTLCLAVRVGAKRAVVGLGDAWAHSPSPGSVWKELAPWKQDFSRNVDKAAAWAKKKSADRIAVDTAKSDAGQGKRADDAKLLAAVLTNPDDNEARLVYADLLTQKGDPRGELITVQCELATAAGPRNKILSKRADAILRRHGRTFSRTASQVALECRFVRGFVGSITATATAFAERGASLFDIDPVEELVLSKPNAKGLATLAKTPHIARLRSFSFSSPFFAARDADVDALRAFLSSPHTRQLRQLALNVVGNAPSANTLFAALSLPRLELLEIRAAKPVVDPLASAQLPALRELFVPGQRASSVASLKKAFARATIRTRIN